MSQQATIRVLIADAQSVFAYGLRRRLEEAGDFEIVAQATDAAEAVRLSAAVHPTLAFLDSELLAPESGSLARLARDDGPKVILWAPGGDTGRLLDSLRLGVRGLLARTAPLGLAEKAARCVAAGQYWIGRDAVGDIVRWLREVQPLPPGRVSGARASSPQLTTREREIVSAVAAGRTNREIAARLSVRRTRSGTT
jgi:DNA-binding NarL/FixJ family response regulator